MKKVIAAINMTIDGYCDHTAITPDEEIHQHYGDLLQSAEVVLFGRITYELMTFWRDLVQHPSGNKSMDEFAAVMDKVPKVVFSHTLKETEWNSARIATQDLRQEVLSLRKQPGGDIFISSRSLIIALINMGLVDEFQLTVHPVIAGKGLPLLDLITDRTVLKLIRTKAFGSGAVTLYYEFAGAEQVANKRN